MTVALVLLGLTILGVTLAPSIGESETDNSENEELLHDDEATLGTDLHDVLIGGEGEDLIQGGDGNDLIDGTMSEEINAADYLRGGSGDDRLVAGSLDRLNGGTGDDSFILDESVADGGGVVIDDYDADSDQIFVRYSTMDDQPTISSESSETETIIYINGQQAVILLGVKSFDNSTIILNVE